MPPRKRSSLLNSTHHSQTVIFPDATGLMTLKTPLLRVSRPVAACQRCRTAKIRCDGKLPACTACERSGRAAQCSSTNSQFAPGKERSYVATLEAQAERLEKRIQEARRRRQSSLSMLDVLSPISPSSRSSTWSSAAPKDQKPKDQKAKARKEMHTIDELVSDFGFL
jgi:Fungal Zn(2)-Cys(6) binuclear cluster domain